MIDKKITKICAVNVRKGSVFEVESEDSNLCIVTEIYGNEVKLFNLLTWTDLGWTTRANLNFKIYQVIDKNLAGYNELVRKQFDEIKENNSWIGDYNLVFYDKIDTEKSVLCFINEYEMVVYGYGDLKGNLDKETFKLVNLDILNKIPLEVL